MPQLSATRQSVQQTISTGLQLGRDTFTQVFGLCLLGGVQSAVMEHYAGIMDMRPPFADPSIPLTQLKITLLILLLALVSIICYAAVLYRTWWFAHGRNVHLLQALYVGARKILPMMIASLMFAIAVVAGLVALIIPGVILFFSLLFYMFFVVLDDARPYQALKSSFLLVWQSNFGYVVNVLVWVMAGIFVIAIIMGFVIALFLRLSGQLPDVTTVAGSEVAVSTGQILITWLATSAVMPFFYGIFAVLFHNLRIQPATR